MKAGSQPVCFNRIGSAEMSAFASAFRTACRALKKRHPLVNRFKLANIMKRKRVARLKRRRPETETRHLVVLDIDNTLVHSASENDPVCAHALRPPDQILRFPGADEAFFMYKRPGLDAFIASMRALVAETGLRLGVWTAAHPVYARKVLSAIWPAWRQETFFFSSRKACTWLSPRVCVKELGLLPRCYSTLLVDDSIDTYSYNTATGHAVWNIAPFTADEPELTHELAEVDDYIHAVLAGSRRFECCPHLAQS